MGCKAIRKFFISIVFLIYFAISIDFQEVKAQNNLLSKELNKLEALQGEEFRERVAILNDSISAINNYNTRQYYLKQLFNITAQKDEIAHIRMLVGQAASGDSAYAQLFEQAFKLAEKHQRIDDMCLVEYVRGQYYIARKQYDSAMIHILNYRDMTDEDDKGEGYRNIINLLGDLYYHAGLYEYARSVYTYLLDMYVEEENWNFYRPYVMMNNLGQISMKTAKPYQAKEWFTKSIQTAEKNLKTDYKYNTIAYSKIKLAESELSVNNIDTAQVLITEIDAYPSGSLKDDVKEELLFAKAKLLFKQNDPLQALEISNKLMPEDSSLPLKHRFIPEIYKFRSEVYCSLKQFDSAYALNQIYNRIYDSLKKQENLAQSMIILADRDHQQTKIALRNARQQMKLLAIIIGFVVIVLAGFVVFYSKLYRSKLELVKKTLENVRIEQEGIEVIDNEDSKPVQSGQNSHEQRELVKQLKAMMKNKKLFLDPKVSIQDIALLLNTNRTYLSNAVNTQLMTSFTNYLNELRVKEAISLIDAGYAVNHTQDALARTVGFSSRTVFISAFKKHTGVLPSFFIANHRKKSPKVVNA